MKTNKNLEIVTVVGWNEVEKKANKFYQWIDGFDGGEGSDIFNNAEEAVADMIRHCSEIRLTLDGYKKLKAKDEAFVSVYEIDEDDEIIDQLDCIRISPDTAIIYGKDGYCLAHDEEDE